MPDSSRPSTPAAPLSEVRITEQFLARPATPPDTAAENLALHQLAANFLAEPALILQQLVDLALSLTNAESSGITLETADRHGLPVFRWVANAGAYRSLTGTTLPSHSPCSVCIHAHQPQVFVSPERHFAYLRTAGIRTVAEVLLLPWIVDNDLRGTLWVVNHTPGLHFNPEHARVLVSLANFAALALRYQRAQELIRNLERHSTAAKLAADLAHRINNPLQSITNALFLLGEDPHPSALSQTFVPIAQKELDRINSFIAPILEADPQPLLLTRHHPTRPTRTPLKSATTH